MILTPAAALQRTTLQSVSKQAQELVKFAPIRAWNEAQPDEKIGLDKNRLSPRITIWLRQVVEILAHPSHSSTPVVRKEARSLTIRKKSP
jgi:hypothetical protein